jgi:hypothetical protein
MAKVASKEKRILDITSMLEQGLERKQILQKLSKTCKVSQRTIDNEIKAAKVVLSKRNKEKEAARLSVTTEEIQKAAKEAIISDLEIEAVLCNIIKGNYHVHEIVKGGVILREVSPMEMINAAKTIYTKRGSNAPTKIAQTNKEGNDIPQNNFDLSKLSDAELRLIAEIQSKGRVSEA